MELDELIMYKELEYPIFQVQNYGKICGPIKNMTVGKKNNIQ